MRRRELLVNALAGLTLPTARTIAPAGPRPDIRQAAADWIGANAAFDADPENARLASIVTEAADRLHDLVPSSVDAPEAIDVEGHVLVLRGDGEEILGFARPAIVRA